MPLGDLEDEAMAKVLIVAQDQVLIENMKRELPVERAFRTTTAASASAVCCDLTASSTAPSPSGSSSGRTAGACTANSSTGPSMRSPRSLIAATCSASASQKRTDRPRRTSQTADDSADT